MEGLNGKARQEVGRRYLGKSQYVSDNKHCNFKQSFGGTKLVNGFEKSKHSKHVCFFQSHCNFTRIVLTG